MVNALFINDTDHCLHPSALEVLDVSDRVEVGERLNARPPGKHICREHLSDRRFR